MDETTRNGAGATPVSREEALVHPEVRFEPSDASAGWILVFAGSLVVLSAVIFVSLWWLFRFMVGREIDIQRPPSLLAAPLRGVFPPEPRLEGLVSYDKLYGLPERGTGAAPKYGWVDRQRKIVIIPIEEAMDIQAAKLSGEKPKPGGGRPPEPPPPSSANSGRTVPGGQPFLSAPGGQP